MVENAPGFFQRRDNMIDPSIGEHAQRRYFGAHEKRHRHVPPQTLARDGLSSFLFIGAQQKFKKRSHVPGFGAAGQGKVDEMRGEPSDIVEGIAHCEIVSVNDRDAAGINEYLVAEKVGVDRRDFIEIERAPMIFDARQQRIQ